MLCPEAGCHSSVHLAWGLCRLCNCCRTSLCISLPGPCLTSCDNSAHLWHDAHCWSLALPSLASSTSMAEGVSISVYSAFVGPRFTDCQSLSLDLGLQMLFVWHISDEFKCAIDDATYLSGSQWHGCSKVCALCLCIQAPGGWWSLQCRMRELAICTGRQFRLQHTGLPGLCIWIPCSKICLYKKQSVPDLQVGDYSGLLSPKGGICQSQTWWLGKLWVSRSQKKYPHSTWPTQMNQPCLQYALCNSCHPTVQIIYCLSFSTIWSHLLWVATMVNRIACLYIFWLIGGSLEMKPAGIWLNQT